MLRFALVLLLSASLQAAEFYTGQAARAVLGQSSFSSREVGVVATSLAVSGTYLYAADSSGHVLTFDVGRIPGAKEEPPSRAGACPLCGFGPIAAAAQRVAPGSAAFSVFGKTVAAVDQHTRRVLIWRDVTSRFASAGPDVVLQGSEAPDSLLGDPVSVAVDGKRLFVGDAAQHRVLVWKTLPNADNQPADVLLGSRLSDSPRSDTIGRPDALVSDGNNLYVADSLDRRILVFTPCDLKLSADGLLNSGTLLPGALAGGTLLTIKANGLTDQTAAATDDGSGPLPLQLAGVEAFFDGMALPLMSVSPSEVRAQLTYSTGDISSGNLYLRAERKDGTVLVSSPVPVAVAPASPGLFAFAGKEPRPGVLLHDGLSKIPVTGEAPAKPGEVITVWACGLHVIGDDTLMAGIPYEGGELSVAPVRAFVNGQVAEVQSISMPATSIGVYEVRVKLPPDSDQSQEARLFISQEGLSSNTVAFTLRP